LDERNSSLAGNRIQFFWTGALGASFLLSIWAAFRGGYVGPDYYTHLSRLIEWPNIFDFSATNPPTYYLLGHGLFRIVGPTNAFPVGLSIIGAGVNCLALWWFFLYSAQRFASRVVHLAFVLFLAFLPVRIIHAATIGTDCATIPLFVLVLFLFDKFLSDRTSTPQNAALLGLALGLAIFTKYSFMALLPAVLIIFIFMSQKRGWKLRDFLAISTLALALPSILALYSFWASARVHGYNTERHWLQKGIPPDMDFRDLLTLKGKDIQLFRAPEYFKREILAPHKHSYLALAHMATFTDPMNLFQDLSVPQRFGSVLIPDQKTRRPWKTPVMQASMLLGTFWAILALIGTPWSLFTAVKHLARDRLEREDVATILGTAYFLLLFLSIPFVHAGALFGYWTPRLILPSLLCFFWAGFLLIDRKTAHRGDKFAISIVFLVAIQCAIETVMLI
jgi:4-amino-4-deoxy-L-arabinose transferase-like glycosyltransferase